MWLHVAGEVSWHDSCFCYPAERRRRIWRDRRDVQQTRRRVSASRQFCFTFGLCFFVRHDEFLLVKHNPQKLQVRECLFLRTRAQAAHSFAAAVDG